MAKKLANVAMKRLFLNVFICMKCNAKRRANPDMVKKRKIKCRKCGSKQLRPKAKEKRGQNK
ncbi:MAG: 50S ribosomal protein L40e [Candidatus Aenigmarchaeota archaeon]|nr:50S ribosomal protein L40e [Candidatus Aenigmarchaeota archaeon]